MINFAVIGGGWRSEFYIRIANALPHLFNINGIYLRNTQKQKEFKQKYNIPIFDNLDKLLETSPQFVISCVSKENILAEIELLCNKEFPVLSETPAGISAEQIETFKSKFSQDWKVQIAEQFHLQPRNQAIKSIIESGILGDVHQVQLSCCHDYHAISLIRFFLGIDNQIPTVNTLYLNDKVMRYNSRNGKITPTEILSEQKIAVLNYGDKTAIYDFNYEQYFSDIRATRIVVRGTNGEIVNNSCTYLKGNSPITFDLTRNYCGSNESLDGMYLETITGNGKILYENPFPKARLTDEEIAIAQCLVKMDTYLKHKTDFYSIYEAILDAQTAIELH